MKKLIMFCFVVVVALGFALLAHAEKGTFEGKTGDEIYVCSCGASCKCGTIGRKTGDCGCGQKLVKTKVAKVEKGRVYYNLKGKELSAPQKGKYICGCGEGCDCGFISQQSGKCGCNKVMIMAGKK